MKQLVEPQRDLVPDKLPAPNFNRSTSQRLGRGVRLVFGKLFHFFAHLCRHEMVNRSARETVLWHWKDLVLNDSR